MASVLKVDKLDPQSGTALEIGTSGDTVSIPSGATLDISASTLTPPATMPASSGINLTALNATNLGSGTVPTARLGSGTASSSTVLYGDQTYKAEPGGGKVNQVVQATNDTAVYSSSASDDLISVAITPSATSSKVLIFGTLWFGADMNPNGGIVLYRDSTPVGASSTQHGGAVGSFWSSDDYFINDSDYTLTSFNFNYLDSPSTTSATTYKFATDSFTELFFNRAAADSTSAYSTSTIIAMEILA